AGATAAPIHAGAGTSMSDLTELTITELAPLLRDRKASPVEVTEAYLERIEHLDTRLNSYILVTADAARVSARQAEQEIAHGDYRGPLHGVPLGVKDLFDLAGTPTTLGSKILRNNVAENDATVVQRLKEARSEERRVGE